MIFSFVLRLYVNRLPKSVCQIFRLLSAMTVVIAMPRWQTSPLFFPLFLLPLTKSLQKSSLSLSNFL